MTSLQPNYMLMLDPVVLSDAKVNPDKSWQPSFGIFPSRPLIYAHTGTLPDYMEFDADGGKYTPRDIVVDAHEPIPGNISVTNTVNTGWTEDVDFNFRTITSSI